MLTKLDLATLQSLIDTSARESIELDFKGDFDPDNPEHRRGLVDDVCAFANARGGWLLWGVAETAGNAAGLPGITIVDEDAFRLRLLNMLGSGLEPKLGGVRIECVSLQSGRYIVGVHVPQSWSGPHRVNGSRRFMVRGDAGNGEYDIQGLRSAFLAADWTSRAWEAFRDDRITRYYADRLPVEIQAGPAALIHLYPLSAASTPHALDVEMALTLPDLAFSADANNYVRLLVDGIIRFGEGFEDISARHVQAFRNGALEAYLALDPDVGKPGLAVSWVQAAAADLLPRWLRGMTTLGVPGPYQFGVTLAGVRDIRPMRDKGEFKYWGVASREQTLLLPVWTIEASRGDLQEVLKGLHRVLHNAFGRDGRQSQFFDLDGAH